MFDVSLAVCGVCNTRIVWCADYRVWDHAVPSRRPHAAEPTAACVRVSVGTTTYIDSTKEA